MRIPAKRHNLRTPTRLPSIAHSNSPQTHYLYFIQRVTVQKLADLKVPDMTEDIVQEIIDEPLDLPESVLAAQREAEDFADQSDLIAGQTQNIEDAPLLSAPKLLQLSASSLQEKTQSLKARGQQLDLLLLKAESYSHFILENQKRSKIAESKIVSNVTTAIDSVGKRKASPQKESATKRSKGGKRGSPKNDDKKSNEDETNTNLDTSALPISSVMTGFCQPSTLVGGTLMAYQLEGLQWLLSLWENGLSGILAGTHTHIPRLQSYISNRFFFLFDVQMILLCMF